MSESRDDNLAGSSNAGDAGDSGAMPRPLRTAPAFSQQMFDRQMARDSMVRWGVLIGLVVFLFASSVGDPATGEGSISAFLPLMLVLGAWIALGVVSTRAAARIAEVSAHIDANPAVAEDILADLIRRWPLHRSVRIMLYHRLAVLRHRQQRFAESAAVCHALLQQNLGSVRAPNVGPGAGAGAVGRGGVAGTPGGGDGAVGEISPTASTATGGLRTNLLLMAAEARLNCGDLPGTWAALTELHQVQLGLVETLQRLAVQTRYEIAAGQHAAAAWRIDEKIRLAELLPPPQCGAMHALLAKAARNAGKPQLADWLMRRAQLIATPEQLTSLLGNADNG